MFEVIIERPRVSCRGEKKKRGGETTPRAFERAPKQSGMGRGRGTKYLNENLQPLRRFLASRAGRPWDAVRSEICAVLSMSSAVQKHVIDHLHDFVEENPIMIDGRPHRPAAFGGKYWPLQAHSRWGQFYVCPRTGLLRKVKCERRKRPRAEDGARNGTITPSAPTAVRESTVDAGRGMGQ
jgi:hypothetical protein